jgi:hypothetical protein
VVTADDVHRISRRLRARCESFFGVVFSTAAARHGAFGLDPVQWYMAGRAAPLGPVSAEVATAVFGSFNPRLVHAGLDGVWGSVTPAVMAQRKLDSAVAGLDGVVPNGGPEMERAITLLAGALDAAAVAGHPLFAGLRTLREPDRPTARLWRLCDMMREHRSDAHVGAWRAAGLDPVEVNVLNELWRGVPSGSIARADMDWEKDDIDAAMTRLVALGYAAAGSITPAGHNFREAIEQATSAQQASIVHALGDDAAVLNELLEPWARAVDAAAKATR